VLLLALTVHTIGRAPMRVIAEAEQRCNVAVGDQPHVAASAAVATIGTTFGDMSLAPERDAARATVACFHVQATFIDERGHQPTLGDGY
jgi:hypothetical protein